MLLSEVIKLSLPLSVSLSYILHVYKLPVSGDILYVFFVTVIFHRIYFLNVILSTISHLLLLFLPRYHRGRMTYYHFQLNIPALESQVIQRESSFWKDWLVCKFWRYAVLTSSEIWSKHNFSVFLRNKIFSFLIHSWTAYPLVVLGSLWDL